MRYEFEGLIHGGAYFRHFTVYWGTTEMQTNIALETPGAQPLVHFRKGKRDIKKDVIGIKEIEGKLKNTIANYSGHYAPVNWQQF